MTNNVQDICGNCHKSWPCKCADPVWVCGICAGDQYQCTCDERSFETKLTAAAPEMYELLRRFIVDDKWGVSMRADLEAARRAAELLRRLED